MQQRIESMTVLRGVAIFLVVLGHTVPPIIRDNYVQANIMYLFIYKFHMPLYFCLSGFLYSYSTKNKNIRYLEFIKDKAQKLMLPYFTMSLFMYALIMIIKMKSESLGRILSKAGYFSSGVKDSVYQVLTYQNHMDKHLWFLYALFIIFALIPFISKIERLAGRLVVLFVLLLVNFASQLYSVTTVDIINRVLFNLFYFYLGYLLTEYFPFKINARLKTAAVTAFIIVSITAVSADLSLIKMPALPKVIIDALTTLTGIVTVIIITDFITDRLSRVKAFYKLLSEYSFDIYLLHQPFIVSGAIAVLVNFTPTPVPLMIIIALMLGILLPYIFSRYIIRKVKILNFLVFGR